MTLYVLIGIFATAFVINQFDMASAKHKKGEK